MNAASSFLFHVHDSAFKGKCVRFFKGILNSIQFNKMKKCFGNYTQHLFANSREKGFGLQFQSIFIKRGLCLRGHPSITGSGVWSPAALVNVSLRKTHNPKLLPTLCLRCVKSFMTASQSRWAGSILHTDPFSVWMCEWHTVSIQHLCAIYSKGRSLFSKEGKLLSGGGSTEQPREQGGCSIGN